MSELLPPYEAAHETASTELVEACKEAIEQAHSHYGRLVLAGEVAASWSNLQVVEGEGGSADIAGALSVTRYGIGHLAARQSTISPSTPLPEPADLYEVRDSITYTPQGGHIGLQEIRGISLLQEIAGEGVTVTTLYLPATVRGADKVPLGSLFAHIVSENARVSHIEIAELSLNDEAACSFYRETFGNEALVDTLSRGLFENEQALEQSLLLLRESAWPESGYGSFEIDTLLSEMRMIALKAKVDRSENYGVNHERLQRLLEFARFLVGSAT